MARMIPSQIYRGTPSLGEKEVFHRLANDPGTTNWTVLHSLDIAHHTKRLSGEVDFVIIIPKKGVLCLEVKGTSSVSREGGMWFYGKNPSPDRRGPFKQSAEAMHSIRHQIKKDNSLSSIPFWSAVAFPYLQFNIHSGEWHHWQVIDSNDFKRKPISTLVLAILDNARQFLKSSGAIWFDELRDEPTKAQCEQIARILRPDFEIYEPPRDKIQRLEQEIKKYTDEQLIALDRMAANPRIIFSGPAGTGKTILAIESARRSQALGNRTLFLCYNRLLGHHLYSETTAIHHRVTVSTIHKHMLNVAGIQLWGEMRPSKFWLEELPQKAIDKLLEGTSEEYLFDEIIIDEAQDLLRNSYLDFIDLSLQGGLSAGKWKLFGDFERQAIYDSNAEVTLEEAIAARFPQVSRYSMRANCRNTPRITTLIHLLAHLKPEYSRVLRPDDGIEPEILYYTDQNDQKRRLLQLIPQLRQNGYTNTDMVVLSTKAIDKSIIQTVGDKDPVKFTSFENASRKRIGCESVYAFKGMESPVIIVTDVEKITGDQAASLFYVAMTRALHRLFILAKNSVRQEVLDITLPM